MILVEALQILSKDLAGWLLFPLAFAIPLISPKIRRNHPLLLTIWFTILLHQAAAAVDTYLFLLPGAEHDAVAFQKSATIWRFDPYVMKEPYITFLQNLYEYLGESLFLGSECSVLAYALSTIFYHHLLLWLSLKERECALMLLYGTLPAPIIFCSVTLRESYQVANLLFLLYLISLIRAQPWRAELYLGVFLSVIGAALLHNAMGPFCLLIGGLGLLWSLYSRNKPAAVAGIVVLVATCLPGTPTYRFLSEHSVIMQQLDRGTLQNYAQNYRQGVNETRAGYSVKIRMDSPIGFLKTAPLVLFYYMYSPLPWQASGPRDLYGLLESFLRMLLTAGFIFQFRKSNLEQRQRLVYLLVCFFSLEALWASGTANWGQAIRHRVVAWPILTLLGGDWFVQRLQAAVGGGTRRQPSHLR